VESEEPQVAEPEAPFDPLGNSGCSAEPAVTLSGDEMEVVEGDQGSERKEVKVAANDAGFWVSFVEER